MTPLSIAEIIRRRKEIAENLRGLRVMEANVYISDNGRIGVDEIVLTDGRGGLVTVAGDEESPIDMRLYTGGKDDPETWQSWSEALRRVCRCAAAAGDRATAPRTVHLGRGEDVTRSPPYLGCSSSSGCRHDPPPGEGEGAVACHRCHSGGEILTASPLKSTTKNRS